MSSAAMSSPSEQLAVDWLVRLYGGQAVRWHDDGSQPSMYDLDIMTLPPTAVEIVLSTVDPSAISAEVAWRNHASGERVARALTRSWTLLLESPGATARMNVLLDEVEPVLIRLESRDVFRVTSGLENSDYLRRRRDPDVALIKTLMNGGVALSRPGTGSIRIAWSHGLQSSAGPDELATEVPDLLTARHPDVLTKLSASAHARREAFIVLDTRTSMGWGTGHWSGLLPSAAPELPMPLTGYWVAGVNGTLWHFDECGWSFHDMSEPNEL